MGNRRGGRSAVSGDSRGGRGPRDEGRQGYGREGGKRFFRKKVCRFCANRVAEIDFKNTEKLLRFLTEKGKILPQRISGNCSQHQRILARAIKRARHAAMIPFLIR